MQRWKPVLSGGVELRSLPLTPEEGFVASRLDGATDLGGLSAVTGLSADRLAAVLDKLVAVGAVARPAANAEPTGEKKAESSVAAGETDGEADPAPGFDSAGTHRKLYETVLRQLGSDERAARAKVAEEPELSAFCFDPLPAVVRALVDNPRFALPQARLVAAHHGTPAGLEAIASRASFAADGGVRRALLRNAQLPAALLRRLYGGRRLLEQHKLVVSHELPEQTRRTARELMRARFAAADADERVEVIVKTEGRCLGALSGLPIDGKTAALLCSRTYTSNLFVQNITRWAACPPALIAHLLKQEVVRRSPPLKLALQRHPNAPASPRR